MNYNMMPYGFFRHPLFYLLVLSFLPLPKLKPPNFNFQITWILVIISLLPATSQHPLFTCWVYAVTQGYILTFAVLELGGNRLDREHEVFAFLGLGDLI